MKKIESNFSHSAEDEAMVKVGMFQLTDGAIVSAADIHNVRSVIAYVDEARHKALGICPKEKMLPWALTSLKTSTQDKTSGKEASAFLLEQAKKEGVTMPALEFCAGYAKNGVEAGQAFLPIKQECRKIWVHRRELYLALKTLGLNVLNHLVWTSSVNGDSFVGVYNVHANFLYWGHQSQTFAVYPVVEIEL